jgi:molybdopterin-guanine dinucleotide biosynthesis protein A
MKKQDYITAFILAGGLSSRIETNKALLQICGKSLIQRLTELLDSIFPEVVISSNEPEVYEFLGKKIVKDFYPGRGPLSGVHSALNFTTSDRNFIISCDMPFISLELIKYIIEYKSDASVIIPKAEGRIQSLCGIYLKNIMSEVELLLVESQEKETGLKGSIHELHSRIKSEIIDVTKMKFCHPDLFFNINTSDDYLYAKKILEQM